MAEDNTYNSNLSLDEIVFENRNKAYGAYDLRTNYRSVLTKAFIFGTILFCVAAFTPFVIMKIKQMTAKETQEVNANLIDIIPEETIIEEPVEEEPPPPPPPGPSKSTTVEVKPQVSESQVYTEVEQLAEFKGGINAFRSKVQNNFDTSVMSGDEGTVKTEVTFVVERDGSITDVKASGPNKDFNAEAIRTVKSVRDKWTPAKINGQAVRYRYRLPLTMQFE